MEKLKEYLTAYHARTGALPPKSLLCNDLNASLDEVNAGLRALVADGTLREFGGRLRLAEAKAQKRSPVLAAVLPAVKALTAGGMAALVRVILLAVSVVAMVISTGYSFVWVAQFLDPVRAMMLSAAVVIYVTFAPEGAALMWRQRTAASIFLSAMLVLTALAALVFSMAMTVIGQYNTMTDVIAREATAVSADTRGVATLEILKAEEKTAQAAVEGLQREVDLQQRALEALTPGTPAHDAAGRNLNALQDRLYYARRPLSAVREKLLAYLGAEHAVTAAEVKREDFYSFAARETGIGRGVIEFILYLIPALFMDIIAPLGMFVALGLSGKKKPTSPPQR